MSFKREDPLNKLSMSTNPTPPSLHQQINEKYPPWRASTPGFEYEEKVSVHLVANKGLVVVDNPVPDPLVNSLSSPRQTGCLNDKFRENGSDNFSKIPIIMSPGGIRLSPSLTSKVHRDNPPSDNCGCAFDQNGSGCSEMSTGHFSKSRHGSSSNGSGTSSLTPLMTGAGDQLKESHKIPVVMKSSLKHTNSNIHLYCSLVLGFSASLFYSLTLVLAKVLQNRDYHPISISFWRYIGVFLPSVPILVLYLWRGKRKKVVGPVWPLRDMKKAANCVALLMRGILGSTAVILRFCSIKYLTIGDSSTISYGAPVFAAIFAMVLFKKEKCGVIPVLIGGLTTFGIYILCEPPFLNKEMGYNVNTLKGVFLATASMICTSGVLILVRHLLQRKLHFTLIMFVLGLWGIFESGVLAVSLNVLKVPDLLPDIVMITGLAVLSFFGQLFVLLAMRIVNEGQQGSAVSIVRSCDILFSFLWQYLFLNVGVDTYRILSTVLIILAVWLICFRKWVISLRESDQMRQRLALILY